MHLAYIEYLQVYHWCAVNASKACSAGRTLSS